MWSSLPWSVNACCPCSREPWSSFNSLWGGSRIGVWGLSFPCRLNFPGKARVWCYRIMGSSLKDIIPLCMNCELSHEVLLSWFLWEGISPKHTWTFIIHTPYSFQLELMELSGWQAITLIGIYQLSEANLSIVLKELGFRKKFFLSPLWVRRNNVLLYRLKLCLCSMSLEGKESQAWSIFALSYIFQLSLYQWHRWYFQL